MTKSKIFFYLSLAFIGGVFCASFWYPRPFDIICIYLLLVLAVIVIILNYKKPAMIAGFIILFFAFGLYLTENRLGILENLKESNFSGQVKIVKEPKIKSNYQNLTAEPVWTSDVQANKFLIRTGIYPEYQYGDMLEVSCQLELPKNSSGQSSFNGQSASSEFDYKMYLAKDKIYYLCQKAEINPTGINKGNRIYAAIFNLKNKLNRKISSLMPSPQAGLLSGLLLGGDDLLSKDYQEAFSKTGTTHIVAVSGFNVTIIAEYLMILGIFFGLWRQQAFWFAVFGIIFFVVLVGMPSSAVRAGVMGILLIWAMKKGRLANAQNAIIFAASVMLLINPLLLRWDVGFQLSFLATLGIVYVYPVFQNLLLRVDAINRVPTVLEILLLTLAAQVFVLPVLMINFGQLSLVSPLANILVLPIIPLTMLLGFITVVAGFIIPPIGQVSAWLTFLPLKYETMVIKFLANLKYSSVEIKNFSWLTVVLWYIILGGVIVVIRKKVNRQSLS